MVIVNINANFCCPDTSSTKKSIQVETGVVSIGEKSLMIEQRVRAVKTGQVKCTCRTIMSGFDIRTNTSVPISEEWIEKFERYEGRPLRRATPS
ncbi:acyl-CoA thioesterase [Duncaniella muris]|uniref:acyl-CoA thioesterase n=1 Tax=Duncaniella muris TaxID=2094150 RepID=UPI003F677CDE